MKLYDFKALSMAEQANVTWERGVYLMDRVEENMQYILYQLEAIYVEFKYDVQLNALTAIKSFINPDLLDPYFAG